MNPICTFDFKSLRYSKSWFSRTKPCLLATRFQSKTLHSYRKFRLKSLLLILASDNWYCKDFKSSYWNPWFSLNILVFLRKYSFNLFHQSVSRIQYICGNWSDRKTTFFWFWNLIVRKFQKMLLILCLPEVESAVSPSLQVICISPNSQLRTSFYLEKCVCLKNYLNVSCIGIPKVWKTWEHLRWLLTSMFKLTFRQTTG